MSEIFIVKNFEVYGNMVNKIREIQGSGKDPIVKISTEKIDRSTQQNRLMHLWFKDISNSTGNSVIEESGRCKYMYFLPVLGSSKNEESRFAADFLRMIWKERGYEYLINVLGRSLAESTRLLTTKEFEQALTDMQVGESKHNLTDPSRYGMEVFK